MSVTLVTAAAFNPVTLAEVKEHLRVDDADEDTLIQAYIDAATEQVQSFTSRQFVTATYDLFLDAFPKVIRIPRAPTQSVTSISYIDADGSSQTLGTAVYDTDFNSEPARVVEADGQSWPSIRGDINSVTVRFVAGYGIADTVPDRAKVAIKMLAADMYENRESKIVGTIIAENPAIERLLWSMRLLEIV